MKGIFVVRPLSASLFKTKSENIYNDVYLIIKSIRQEVMSGIAKGSDNTPIWQNDKLEIFANLQEEDRLQVQLFDYKLNNGQLIGECEILLQKIIDRKLLLTCYEIKTVTSEIIGQLSMEIEFNKQDNENDNQKILKTEEINNSNSPSQTKKAKNTDAPIISTKQAYTVPSSYKQQQNIQQQQYYQPQQNKLISNSIDGSNKNKLNTTKDSNYIQTQKYESDKKIIQQKTISNYAQNTSTTQYTNNSQYTNTPVPNVNQKQINPPSVQQFAVNDRKTNSIITGNSQIKNNSAVINTPSKNTYPQNRSSIINQQNLQKGTTAPTVQPQPQIISQPNQLYPPQQQQIYTQPQQYGQPQVVGMPQQPIPQQAMQQMYQNAPRQTRQSYQGPQYPQQQQQYIRKLY